MNVIRNKRVYIAWIILGVALIFCEMVEFVDGFWSGLGGALIGMAINGLVRLNRYQKDETYREAVDTQKKDERNQFLLNKAWATAGYLYMMAGAVGTFVFKILGMDDLSLFCGMSVCLISLLHWFSYLWLKRKY